MSGFEGRAYQARFDALAEQGIDIHGEATLVRSYAPTSVLDAGCGTGRVAIELAHHGIEVVGVDVDASMIAEARRRARELAWVEADLAVFDLGRQFDVVVLAGNVPLFCPVATRRIMVERCAAHVGPGGVLITGFQLDREYGLDAYDEVCREAGLTLMRRLATWAGQPYGDGPYAVSVHATRLGNLGSRV
ncbi:MAG: class I SAM-dependent methyltransferase [Nitrososphaerales archaeon]